MVGSLFGIFRHFFIAALICFISCSGERPAALQTDTEYRTSGSLLSYSFADAAKALVHGIAGGQARGEKDGEGSGEGEEEDNEIAKDEPTEQSPQETCKKLQASKWNCSSLVQGAKPFEPFSSYVGEAGDCACERGTIYPLTCRNLGSWGHASRIYVKADKPDCSGKYMGLLAGLGEEPCFKSKDNDEECQLPGLTSPCFCVEKEEDFGEKWFADGAYYGFILSHENKFGEQYDGVKNDIVSNIRKAAELDLGCTLHNANKVKKDNLFACVRKDHPSDMPASFTSDKLKVKLSFSWVGDINTENPVEQMLAVRISSTDSASEEWLYFDPELTSRSPEEPAVKSPWAATAQMVFDSNGAKYEGAPMPTWAEVSHPAPYKVQLKMQWVRKKKPTKPKTTTAPPGPKDCDDCRAKGYETEAAFEFKDVCDELCKDSPKTHQDKDEAQRDEDVETLPEEFLVVVHIDASNRNNCANKAWVGCDIVVEKAEVKRTFCNKDDENDYLVPHQKFEYMVGDIEDDQNRATVACPE